MRSVSTRPWLAHKSCLDLSASHLRLLPSLRLGKGTFLAPQQTVHAYAELPRLVAKVKAVHVDTHVYTLIKAISLDNGHAVRAAHR